MKELIDSQEDLFITLDFLLCFWSLFAGFRVLLG